MLLKKVNWHTLLTYTTISKTIFSDHYKKMSNTKLRQVQLNSSWCYPTFAFSAFQLVKMCLLPHLETSGQACVMLGHWGSKNLNLHDNWTSQNWTEQQSTKRDEPDRNCWQFAIVRRQWFCSTSVPRHCSRDWCTLWHCCGHWKGMASWRPANLLSSSQPRLVLLRAVRTRNLDPLLKYGNNQ